MASTYSSRLRLELQATGENSGTWGTRLNENALQLIDDAIGAFTTIDLAGSDVTLTNNNGATDQARSAMLLLNGVLTSNVEVVLPSVTQGRWVRNNTSGSFTITAKTQGGTGYVIPQGTIVKLLCDSVSVFPATFAVSADVSALGTAALRNVGTSVNEIADVSMGDARYVRLSAVNTITNLNVFTSGTTMAAVSLTGAARGTIVTLTYAASITPDFVSGNTFLVSLAGAATFTYPANAVPGQVGQIYIVQDATGGRTATFNSTWKFPNGTAPTLTSTGGAVDMLSYSVRATSVVDAALRGDFR